ncbi:hypothetical protein MKW98_011142 [Papaver atlanticum]|uniref:Uncharacterized protein n=1 Tax=Papaver atlanticum TaxID=357466 RepID=A0AAD4TJ36_9MAGN|nr:hypothetical protein MKW98_011142 [Papaver atlanticum]
MANAQNLRILDSTPGDTPLVYTQFQYHYQNSNAQGLRNSDLFEQRMLLEREPWDEFRPGPVFVLDCQCRQSATSGLRRFKYTMKFNEVQYRLIEYRPLPPPAPAQGPPPLMIQEAQQEALEDADQPVGENMLELPV